MKRSFFSFLIIGFFFSNLAGEQKKFSSALTYAPWNHGRLGDHLLLYIKAKWISYHFNLPLLHKPFEHSDKFMLYVLEKPWQESYKKYFQHIINIKNVPEEISLNKSILYEVDYSFKDVPIFKVIQDKSFLKIIKQHLAPINTIPKLALPKDKHCVAVHIRKGGGYDAPLNSQQIYNQPQKEEKANSIPSDKRWPLKFPPDQYYLDQIVELSKMLNNEPMYIYIFTDDQNPKKLVESYQKYLNNSNLTFDCRQKNNHHSKNVTEDLFSIGQFDYFIRGNSHFAQVADIISNHKIIISPTKYIWQENKLIITEVKIRER